MEKKLPCAKAAQVDAILMASGFSARFGVANKLFAPFCGKPLLQHTLQLVEEIGFGHIWLVYSQQEVLQLAKGYSALPLLNTNPARGPCESVRLGVQASAAEYFQFFMCDQPLLDAKTVHALIAAAKPGYIAQPVQGGQPGNPTIFSKAYRQQLLTLKDGQNPRSIKAAHPHCVVSVPACSPHVLRDVDTPEELAKLALQCAGNE